MKFLVIWSLEQSLLSDAMVRAIARMPEYGARLEEQNKVVLRYHIVGAHGGAWIYDVDSHEEFERLLAVAPVFNFARYTVHPLADMSGELVAATGGSGEETSTEDEMAGVER